MVMNDVRDGVACVKERMDALESARERSVIASRSIIRKTKKAIHSIHTEEEYENILNSAMMEYNSLISSIGSEPEVLLSGPVADAMMELSEACILSSIVLGKSIPSYLSLNVTPQSWAMGLADCLGELRRILLSHLMNDRIKEAKEVFDKMEIVCDSVLSFDVPDAILPIRRKQDVSRSIMERTRSDITNAIMNARK